MRTHPDTGARLMQSTRLKAVDRLARATALVLEIAQCVRAIHSQTQECATEGFVRAKGERARTLDRSRLLIGKRPPPPEDPSEKSRRDRVRRPGVHHKSW